MRSIPGIGVGKMIVSKGDQLINRKYQVVDIIRAQTGALATIFLDDTRIATNVTPGEWGPRPRYQGSARGCADRSHQWP